MSYLSRVDPSFVAPISTTDAAPDDNLKRRRHSRSPGTRAPLTAKRHSAQRIPEYNPPNEVHENHFLEAKNVPTRTSSTDLGQYQSEYRYFLEMYFWPIVRIVLFVGSAYFFPLFHFFPIATGLALIYSDIYVEIAHPNRLSKWSIVLSLLVLILVISLKVPELHALERPVVVEDHHAIFTLDERQALEHRLIQHSKDLINTQVAALSQKISGLRAGFGQPITSEMVEQTVQKQLEALSRDLTPSQRQQIQLIVSEYLNSHIPSPTPGSTASHTLSDAEVTQIVHQQIELARKQLTNEIHSVRDLINTLSPDSLRSIVSGWVKDEVRQKALSDQPSTPSADKLHEEIKGWNLPSDQESTLKRIIADSLDKYVAVYSRLLRPTLAITPRPEPRPHATQQELDLLGVHQFGIWNVPRDDAQLHEFELKTSEPVHPYLLLVTLHYGNTSSRRYPHFLCPIESWQLSCKDNQAVFGSGNLRLDHSEPLIPVQDFELTPTAQCSNYRLRVKANNEEECAHGAGYIRVMFKIRLFGFK